MKIPSLSWLCAWQATPVTWGLVTSAVRWGQVLGSFPQPDAQSWTGLRAAEGRLPGFASCLERFDFYKFKMRWQIEFVHEHGGSLGFPL